MRKVLLTFPTEREAERFARSFDHARRFNRVPVLEVAQQEDGEWAVVNPDTHAKYHAPRTPVP